MLTALRIKNLALVSDLTLDLQPGYNVITGETGAGKSIIIGALNLVLGERADRTLIRAGADNCSVEAVFDVSKLKAPLKAFLDENGLEPCEDGQLLLKRTFTAAGTNRQFVNGSATSLAALGDIGRWLMDMHGPYDHQSLLNPGNQLNILDAFGDNARERAKFGELVRQRNALESEKAVLIVDEKTYIQQLDLLRFQVKEIESAQLKPDEEMQVEQDYQRASNGAKLLQFAEAALDILTESETSLLTQAGVVGRSLQELQRVDVTAASLAELHAQAVSTLGELQTELSHYAGKVDMDPEQLQQLEERVSVFRSLKRKYGATLAEVIAHGVEARAKLQSLELRDVEVARINNELQKLDAELLRAGKALSEKRHKLIPKLSKAISNVLEDLGFKQSRFDVALTSDFEIKTPLSPSGFDKVEFQFAPNPGEPARPLRAIASSGEMARVMLAIKTVLAAEDEIPVLVFDEVDANVGGETANAVGEKMAQIAQKRQVLCITHLPQVAAPATAHYVVAKQVKDGRTISEINLLGKKERVVELTRMLGGQGDAAKKHAEALLRL